MSQETGKPVVFLTFANAAEHGYLMQLKRESALLRDLFLPLHRQGRIELVREESLDNTELPKLLNQYKDQIAIFHYGGHADGGRLTLEDGEGNVSGLAALLGLQKGLRLAFLNGCSTQGQVRPYLEAGVPVVLATSRSISDEEATFFAEHFYHALLNRHTIREAFQSASGALKTRNSAYKTGVEETVTCRSVVIRDNDLKEMPWRLYVQEGMETALEWSISNQAAKDQKSIVGEEAVNKENKSLEQRAWSWVLAAGVIVALFAGIAEISGFNLKDLFGDSSIDSFSVTVLVHGKEGRDDRILRKQGEVVLDFGTTREEAPIDDEGEATFKELPLGYVGEKATISIDHPQPYFPTDRNAEYTLEQGKAIYLEVELAGMDKVQGRVLDFQTEEPLDSVRVSYRDVATYTDDFGWYELEIPPDMQTKFVRLNFYKTGYKMQDIDSIAPHTQQEIGILLERQ